MKRGLLGLVPLLFILFACQKQQLEMNYYLSLLGESEIWKLTGYEIMLTSDEIKIGNGKLIMKEKMNLLQIPLASTHMLLLMGKIKEFMLAQSLDAQTLESKRPAH